MPTNKQGIGIHIIQRDKAGVFPRILANLSGIEFKQVVCADGYKKPSFHYSRYQNCNFGKKQDEKYFYYTADITLEKPEDLIKDNGEAKGAVVLSLPTPDLPSSTSEKANTSERDNIINAINKLLFNSDGDNRLGRVKIPGNKYIYIDNIETNKEYINHLLKNCIFQITTSPETYRAKLFNLLKNWDFFKKFTKEKAKAEIERAYIDTTFSYSDDIPNGSPLAKLYLCCRYGNRPGSLAAAINTLLFREWKNTQNKNDIFNIMFYMDYFSFAPSVAYDIIYGQLEHYRKRICEAQSKNVIERILICPITDTDEEYSSWTKYANDLWSFLGKGDYKARGGEISVDKEIPKNLKKIFIYRNGRDPCEIGHTSEITKEFKQHPNEGCDICKKYWR